MRVLLLTACVALLAPLGVPPVQATHESGCPPTTSPTPFVIGSGGANTWSFYVYVDVGQATIPLPFIYQEGNGIDFGQRQDFIQDDTCAGHFVGDLLIW